MQENQSLREELLESNTELRRLRAEFDALPRDSPTSKPVGTQGPMPHDEELPRSAAFPKETSNYEDDRHRKPRNEYEVPGFMKTNRKDAAGGNTGNNPPNDAWANYMGQFTDKVNQRNQLGIHLAVSSVRGKLVSANPGQSSRAKQPNPDQNSSNP